MKINTAPDARKEAAGQMSEAVIFQQFGLPVFQNKVYPTAQSAKRAVTGSVELIQCQRTGLVYNHLFDPVRLTYDEDYQNEQAHSPTFRRHLEEVIRILFANIDASQSGIEIGCGKAYFLEMLAAAGANIKGYDPAYEGSNPAIVRAYFGETETGILPDYVILRHVLEHIPFPWPFLQRLSAQCKERTKIYIEVPCFDWIVEHNAFYDIFYEHVNYFSLDVLRSAFSRVLDSGKLFGGQYLYVIADLSSFRIPCSYGGAAYRQLPMNAYLREIMERVQPQASATYIWGAGAKGITFSNILSRQGLEVCAIIDINPAKQGKFAGLSGIPIEAPENALHKLENTNLFVMNPVYLDEIKTMVGKRKLNWISVV